MLHGFRSHSSQEGKLEIVLTIQGFVPVEIRVRLSGFRISCPSLDVSQSSARTILHLRTG